MPKTRHTHEGEEHFPPPVQAATQTPPEGTRSLPTTLTLDAAAGSTRVGDSSNKIKLPEFTKEKPREWFMCVEQIFLIYDVSSPAKKFAHVVAQLPPDVFRKAHDILRLPDGPGINRYELLKSKLCKHFGLSLLSAFERFNKLPSLQSGQKPSNVLEALQDTLFPDADVNHQLVRAAFISRLPVSMQSAIFARDFDNLSDLAAFCDTMCFSDSRVSPLHSEAVEICALPAETADLHMQGIHAVTRRASSTGGNTIPQTNCWYHRRFGVKAKACNQPCSFLADKARR